MDVPRGTKLVAKIQKKPKTAPLRPPFEPYYWPEGLEPYDFQLDAIEFALNRGASYLALDPGLGKTIIAALILNKLNLEDYCIGVYICPPFLVTNTTSEFIKWGVSANQFLVMPDTLIGKPAPIENMNAFLNVSKAKKILFVDEAHRFKNEKANRTIDLFKIALNSGFTHVIFMSGTPLPNSRPFELWPILKRFAPEVFGTKFFTFAKKYCGAYHNGFAWQYDGFTNRREFKARIFKSFMLRIKKDVIELPDKTEGLLTVGEGMGSVLSKIERKVLAHYSPKDLIEGKITKSLGKGTLHMAEYLKHLGEYKLKYAMPYIENILTNSDENILIFAHHKGVIEKLEAFLIQHKPLVISGKVPKQKRQDLVNEYQNNPKRRVFIGNIAACGVGFTLTKATRVLFIEFSWRDGDNVQAGDRAHRIGQNEKVLVQYVVLKDSFDRKRMEVLLTKRQLAV